MANVVDLSTGGGLAAILLWSTTFGLARSLSEQLGPLSAATAVYLVGGCLCLAPRAWSGAALGRVLTLPWRYVVGCGLLFVFYTAVLYVAVGLARDREQLLEIALVNYLWPAATVLLSIPLLGKRSSGWLLPGTSLALAGVWLVMTPGATGSWAAFLERLQSNPAAYALALGAAISWAFYSNLARRWSGAGGEGAVGWFMLVTGVTLFAARLCRAEPTSWTPRAATEVMALGGMTALAYALWDRAMRQGNLLLVAAASYFAPLFSTLVSCAYLRVAPGARIWTGCGLIVLGSLVTWSSVTDRGQTAHPHRGP